MFRNTIDILKCRGSQLGDGGLGRVGRSEAFEGRHSHRCRHSCRLCKVREGWVTVAICKCARLRGNFFMFLRLMP